MFPQLVGSTTMLTKGFSPLDDDITILYARSTTALMSDMMRQYSAQPTACFAFIGYDPYFYGKYERGYAI